MTRKALFKCIGTGKLVYFEEVNSKKLRFLYGHNKNVSNTKEATEWLEDNGIEHVKIGNFEIHFDHYNSTLMRCWLHRNR